MSLVKTFQQYSFLVTVFFFWKETISYVGFSFIFDLNHTTRRKVYENSQYRNPYLLNCSQSKYTEAFPVSLSFLSCPEECDVFFFRNIAEPSLTKDYSLLDEGDTIKSIAISPYFLYRLEARERGSNGAIYQAPESYRFVCLLAGF